MKILPFVAVKEPFTGSIPLSMGGSENFMCPRTNIMADNEPIFIGNIYSFAIVSNVCKLPYI